MEKGEGRKKGLKKKGERERRKRRVREKKLRGGKERWLDYINYTTYWL